MNTCCNCDCRQGRDCPNRHPAPDRVVDAAICILVLLVLLCAVLGEVYR